jgi:transcription-repair coupling factor (superfamily II helicase)
VTYPEALAEMVVSKQTLDTRTLVLEKDQTIAISDIEKTLRSFGFKEVDYVYEPGQFALRGSILDVYSYSCEYPYRVDFFGDDIDSIRTFEVEDQLSKDQRERIEIVPELAVTAEEKEPFLSFVPKDVVLVTKDFLYVRDAIERTYQEGFSAQAKMEQMEQATEMEQREIERQLQKESQLITGVQFMNDAETFRRIDFGHSPSTFHSSLLTFHFNISVQPLFHKNFDLLTKSFEDYLLQGYQIFILADSQKQNERLREIL